MTTLNSQSLQSPIKPGRVGQGQTADRKSAVQWPRESGRIAPQEQNTKASAFCLSAALLFTASQTNGQEITADINVQLRPVIEHIDVVTDINVVGKTMFVCTQPGQLYRKDLSANSTPELFGPALGSGKTRQPYPWPSRAGLPGARDV